MSVRRETSRGAFTLLELVLVMLIISIAMALIVPSLGNVVRGRRAGDTAAQIVTLCNHARTQSISEGRPFRLNLDTRAGSYWLTAQDGAKFTDLDTDFGQHFTVAGDLRLDTDLTQQQDGTYVTFKPDGRVDPAPVTVEVNDRTGGGSTQVACESTTELFHVVKAVKK